MCGVSRRVVPRTTGSEGAPKPKSPKSPSKKAKLSQKKAAAPAEGQPAAASPAAAAAAADTVPQHSRRARRGGSSVAVACACLAACAGAWRWGELLRASLAGPPRDGFEAILARTPRLSQTAGPVRLEDAAANGRPVLWSRSFVREWDALRTWDVATLASRIPWVVARVQRGAPEFVLTAEHRGGTAPLLQAAPTWEPLRAEKRNVSVRDVLAGGGGEGGEYHYYSGDLGQSATAHWDADALLAELEPHAGLQLRDVPPLSPDEPAQPAAGDTLPANRTALRLWLTSGGVLSRTHYDKAHNALAQIVGTKRIVLWPPEALPALHLYPAIHAAYRQSQLSLPQLPSEAPVGQPHMLREGAAGAYALLDAPTLLGASGGALSVELSPGDLLYIPPYWAHAVRSTEPSVALASFSTSWEQARWARSAWAKAPLGRFGGSLCSRARGASLLVSSFLRAWVLGAQLPAGYGSPRAFLARLWASRYAPLYGPLHADADADGRASASLAECVGAPPDAGAPERDAELRGRLRRFAGSIAALLVEPDDGWRGRAFGAGASAELAADYVEELLGWACGADGAWRLLRHLAREEEFDATTASAARGPSE